MKMIINSKLYNTETATKIGEWDNGYYPNDFNFEYEILYKKKTGEYFLYGHGGPLSRKYRISVSGGWQGGRDIIPMSIEEAKEWAENHLDADEYIAIFGEPEE